MPISLYLRSIDHDAAIEQGRGLVREAVETGDVTRLRCHLLGLEVDRRDNLIEERKASCALVLISGE